MIYNVTTSGVTFQRKQSTTGNARLRFYNEGSYTAEITVGVDTRKVDPGARWDVAVSDVQVKMVSLDGPTTIRTYRVTSEATDESDINGEIDNAGASIDAYTKSESDAKFADKEQTEVALESLATDIAGKADTGTSYTKTESDGKYVALTGNQSVAGNKTFSSEVVVGSTASNNVRVNPSYLQVGSSNGVFTITSPTTTGINFGFSGSPTGVGGNATSNSTVVAGAKLVVTNPSAADGTVISAKDGSAIEVPAPDLSGYVTTSTEQTIAGVKTFTPGVKVGVAASYMSEVTPTEIKLGFNNYNYGFGITTSSSGVEFKLLGGGYGVYGSATTTAQAGKTTKLVTTIPDAAEGTVLGTDGTAKTVLNGDITNSVKKSLGTFTSNDSNQPTFIIREYISSLSGDNNTTEVTFGAPDGAASNGYTPYPLEVSINGHSYDGNTWARFNWTGKTIVGSTWKFTGSFDASAPSGINYIQVYVKYLFNPN